MSLLKDKFNENMKQQTITNQFHFWFYAGFRNQFVLVCNMI